MRAYEYKRDLNHNYLILDGGKAGTEKYREKIMERNQITGLLPYQIRYIDGQTKYYYDISSKQPIGTAFSIQKMEYGILCKLFSQLEAIARELENYLLDSSLIWLDIRYLYWDMKGEQIYLTLCEDTEESQEAMLRRFSEDVLNLIDHADKKAVDLAYSFYQKVADGELDLLSLTKCMQRELTGIFPVMQEKGMSEGEECVVGNESHRIEGEMWRSKRETEISDLVQGEDALENFPEKPYGNAYEERRKPIRSRILNVFLVVVILLFLGVCGVYIWLNYALTEREMLIGGGFVAMAVAAMVLYMMKRRGKGEELDVLEPGIVSQEAFRGKSVEKRTVSSALPPAKEQKIPVCEEVYGETTYFQGEEEERCLEGRVHGKQVTISIAQTPYLIGKQKGAVHFVLSDPSVSRIHAAFMEQEGRLFLQDMNSKNGTFKNEVCLDTLAMAEVKPGDEIRFGRLRFTYH